MEPQASEAFQMVISAGTGSKGPDLEVCKEAVTSQQNMKKQRNRDSAQKCRQRKKKDLQNMQQHNKELEARRKELKSEVKKLKHLESEWYKAVWESRVCCILGFSPANPYLPVGSAPSDTPNNHEMPSCQKQPCNSDISTNYSQTDNPYFQGFLERTPRNPPSNPSQPAADSQMAFRPFAPALKNGLSWKPSDSQRESFEADPPPFASFVSNQLNDASWNPPIAQNRRLNIRPSALSHLAWKQSSLGLHHAVNWIPPCSQSQSGFQAVNVSQTIPINQGKIPPTSVMDSSQCCHYSTPSLDFICDTPDSDERLLHNLEQTTVRCHTGLISKAASIKNM